MQARNICLQKDFWSSFSFDPYMHILENYNLPSDVDGDTVIKYVKGLEIDEGAELSVENRCKGLVFFIDGDCTINGTLNMTAKGPFIEGDDLAIDYKKAQFLVNPNNFDQFEYTISKDGGLGGAGLVKTNSAEAGKSGSTSGEFACGGGGSGGARGVSGTARSGRGAQGTSYSGGSGGGGCVCDLCSATASGGTNFGGPGGNANACQGPGAAHRTGAGGGAGNNGGLGKYVGSGTGIASPGENGTGGLIVLVIKGNLIIGPNGLIAANGSKGGDSTTNGFRVGGGGSGGGSINILYTKNITNNGAIQANGGAGGFAGTYNGGAGGFGSIRVEHISF